MNVPFIMVGIIGLLAAMFSFPPWADNGLPTWAWGAIIWAAILAYGPVADAINRKECEADAGAAKAIVDGHRARIERNHGVAARERAVALAMKELRHGLTRAEERELAFLCAEERLQKAAE